MPADGQYYWFSAKEAYVSLLLTDSYGSQAGPTYGPAQKVVGIQEIGINKNATLVNLPGDDKILATEDFLDTIDVTLKHGVVNQEALALIQGGAAWTTPTEAHYVFDTDHAPYVKLEIRTDHLGKNGEDLVITLYKVKFGSYNRQSQQRQYMSNDWQAKAVATDSLILTQKNGVPTYVNAYYSEVERATAAALHAPLYTAAPTIASSTPADNATGVSDTLASISVVFSNQMDVNSINNYTITLCKHTGLVDVPIKFSLASDLITLTITPATGSAFAFTAANVYDLNFSTSVRDVSGNYMAATKVDFTTT